MALVGGGLRLVRAAASGPSLWLATRRWNHHGAHANTAVPGEYGAWDIRNKDRGMYEDYPHVHKVSAQFKPQREVTYEDFQERRNLEDKLHEDDEILTVWSVDESDFTTPWTAFGQLLVMGGALFGLYQLVKAWDPASSNPLAKKEYLDRDHV